MDLNNLLYERQKIRVPEMVGFDDNARTIFWVRLFKTKDVYCLQDVTVHSERLFKTKDVYCLQDVTF